MEKNKEKMNEDGRKRALKLIEQWTKELDENKKK